MPLFGARGGSPAGGGSGGRGRRGNNNGRVVTVVKDGSGIYKPSRGGARGGYQNGRSRQNVGGRGSRGRGGSRGRQGSSGRGRGRGRGRGGRGDRNSRFDNTPSFLPEGKQMKDLTDAERDEVTRQRNEWQAAQLDKDLITHMAKNGKPEGALSILDDDLEAYKRAGGKQKQQAEPAAETAQDGVEAMES